MVFYTFDKLYYQRDTAVVSGLRGPKGQRLGGAGSPIDLSVSSAVSARMRKGIITSGKAKGSHRSVVSGGKIRKVVVQVTFDSLV